MADGTPAGEGEADAARPVIVCDCRDLPLKTRRQSQRAVCVGSREPGVPTTVIWSAGSAGHDDASASVSPDARVRRGDHQGVVGALQQSRRQVVRSRRRRPVRHADGRGRVSRGSDAGHRGCHARAGFDRFAFLGGGSTTRNSSPP